MFEEYSKEQIERIGVFITQMKNDNITKETFTEEYCNKYLSKEDYIIFKKILKEYKKQKQTINTQININELSPYIVLCIEEKEYTKEELLNIVEKRINFYKSLNLNKELEKQFINDVLDAYNDIMKIEKNINNTTNR